MAIIHSKIAKQFSSVILLSFLSVSYRRFGTKIDTQTALFSLRTSSASLLKKFSFSLSSAPLLLAATVKRDMSQTCNPSATFYPPILLAVLLSPI